MKVAEMTVGVKRDIRLEKYNVSQCHIELKAVLNPDDDPVKIFEELKNDVTWAVENLIAAERENYRIEVENAIKSKSEKLQTGVHP